MFDFIFKPAAPQPVENELVVHGRRVRLVVVRNHRARRYLLRLRGDGTARLTIPRRGSVAEGRQFAERQTEWLAQQLEKLAQRPVKSKEWRIGTGILFRGETVTLEAEGEPGFIRCGDQRVKVPDANGDLRLWVVRHLWKIAAAELPVRTLELAAVHGVAVQRVTVRNQRSRWGSCSRRGTISLNWRLIQTPVFVRDYIVLHELMHRRQMNHSDRFWQEVERVCPDYRTAEKWLKGHSDLLR